MSESLHESYGKKACRVCTDFKSWMKSKKHSQSTESNSSENQSKAQENTVGPFNIEPLTPEAPSRDCPLDLNELGQGSWGFLHTMAAYYPEKPTLEQQENMAQFMKLFSKFFPCQECGKDLEHRIKKSPPVTGSQYELSQWLCRIHNQINKRLGKAQFDCSKVDERWKDGWKDGSCDY